MSFLAPTAFAFLATLLGILLLYILKRRRVEHRVSSTLLWERFLAESQANSPFQKLRRHWLMLIQMVLAILMVLALARPFIDGNQKILGLNVILIDASGSMLSRDEEPTRFEAARSAARDIIESMEPGARATIIRMGPVAEVAQSATSRKTLLLDALASLKASSGPADSVAAFQLAESLVRNPSAIGDSEEAATFVPQSQIHLISDGSLSGMDRLATRNLPIRYYPIGKRANNTAITSVDATPSPEDPTRQVIFVQMENNSEEDVNSVLTLSFNGQDVEDRQVEIPASSDAQLIFVVEQSVDGVYEVSLNHEDDLPGDNQAWIVSTMPTPVRILLVTAGNGFLEKALRSIRNIQLEVRATFPDTSDSKSDPGYDILIADRMNPGEWNPIRNCLWIQCSPDGWFGGDEVIEAPIITSFDADHPALRFVGLDQVLIARTSDVQPPPWASPIIQSTSAPLIMEGETDGIRHLWVGFDFLESNWPRMVSFPIFMANAINWLNTSGQQKDLTQKLTGETIEFRPATTGGTMAVISPGGGRKPVEPDPENGQIYVSDTDTPGVYQFQVSTNTIDIAVNALHRSESMAKPQPTVKLGNVSEITGSEIKEAKKELWPWLIALALAVASFEWWYYHKRTA